MFRVTGYLYSRLCNRIVPVTINKLLKPVQSLIKPAFRSIAEQSLA